MKIQSRRRFASVTGVALAGTLALSGCGSDTNKDATPGASGNAATPNADCPSGTLNGEGSSAQKNAIEEAIRTFQEKCKGASVNYAATGSGAGIKQFIAGQVNFGGSDSALKTKKKDGKIEADDAAKACGSPAWNLPMVTGPVAFAYNLKDVDLVINPEVAAKIFNGLIKKWNDPAIAAINKDAKLPDLAIKVFFRSDDSGTTENFTKWLSAAAPNAWTAEAGKKWTGKGEGKPQNTGVATAVKNTEGGVTYTEWSFAKDNKLGIAKVDNGGGPVELNAETVGKSVATAKQVGKGNDLSLKLDYATKEAGAYPILLVAYEIVCSKAKDPAGVPLTKAFLKHFSSTETQKSLEDLGYAPLPAEIQTKVAAAVDALS